MRQREKTRGVVLSTSSRLHHLWVLSLLALVLFHPSSASALDTSPFRSLLAWVADFKSTIPGVASETFILPTVAEETAFGACFALALDGPEDDAAACLDPLGFDLKWLVDDTYLVRYLVGRQRGPSSLGLGAFVIERSWARNVAFVVNHPLYDSRTPEVGCAMLQELSSRVLLIAGTHRCANAALSPCDGSSTTCGDNSYHIADTAHVTNTLMRVAHEVLLAQAVSVRTLNVHGQSSDIRDIVLSDGTNNPASANAFVNRVRMAATARGLDAGSCNWPADAGLSLCGTNNVLGRLYNGAPSPCDTPSTTATEGFLHLELKAVIRNDPALLIAAIGEVLPLERNVLRAVRSGVDVHLRFSPSVLPLTVRRDVDPRFITGPLTVPTTGPDFIDPAPPPGLLFYSVD